MSEDNYDKLINIVTKTKKLLKENKFQGWRSFCSTLTPLSKPSEVWRNIRRYRAGLTQDTVNHLNKGISRKLLLSPMESTCTPHPDSTHVEVKTEPCVVKQEPIKCEETPEDSKLCEQETCAPEGSVPRYGCDICGKLFMHKTTLTYHINHHLYPEKLYECDICCRRYSFQCHLRRHLKSHYQLKKREKPYSCDACEGSSCSECGNKFSTMRALKKHMAIHKGDRVQFACSLCNKTFTQKYNWALHMRSHAGHVKYFPCSLCDKAFTTKKDTIAFVCGMCERPFSQKPNLVRHINTMHEESKRFACDLCYKTYARLSTLQKHSLTHIK
ncbi:Uncharacterized protein OBRU01_23317 [Operophtera brumata]|uniref:C2H2-type domain-containing protein n=1 Tax=Operophtera brumata TaxID=104452 RepID=A0A0L7KNM8_OPEBR|nr:Uncharacterized protein OBRU01_23317 [Operophtera brumata]